MHFFHCWILSGSLAISAIFTTLIKNGQSCKFTELYQDCLKSPLGPKATMSWCTWDSNHGLEDLLVNKNNVFNH